MISLIINGKNENHLQDTVRSALCMASHAEDIEVIVVTDGQGVDIDRHTGLLKASHDLCCVADAHLIFTPGWDSKIRDQFMPCNLYCTQCERITDADYALSSKHERHYGAAFAEHVTCGIPGISAIWCKDKPSLDSRLVPCILGGFYAFSRRHYFDALLAPWSVMRSYGKSEEMLSIINWKLGGNSVCVRDLCIGHMFRTGQTPPYSQHWHDMACNSLMLAYVAADTPEEQHRLFSNIGPGAVDMPAALGPGRWAKAQAIREQIVAHRASGRTWQALMQWSDSIPKRRAQQ